MPPLPTGALRALIFDMDDTLYPERDFVLGGFRAVAHWARANLGIPAGDGYQDLRRLFQKGVRGDTFDRWLALHDLHDQSERLVPQLVRVYREHEPRLVPFADVPQALHRFRRRFRLGLLSDGFLAVQQRKLQALALRPAFDSIVFSDRWGREAWKPSERPFRAALQELHVPAQQSAYIADNPRKDFLAPRRLGMTAIWLRLPGGEYAAHEPPDPAHAPHLQLVSWPDLVQWIRDIP